VVHVGTAVAVEDPDEDDAELVFFRISGTGACSGEGCSTTTRATACEFSGLKLELDPEAECEPDLRVARSRPLSVVRLASLSPLASRSRSLTPTLPMPSPTFASGLPAWTLSRSENDDVRAILRPRGCSACGDSEEEDAVRPREGAGSDGTRRVLTAGTLARGAEAAVEEAALVDAVISLGEGVRERDLLRDCERDLDRRASSWTSEELEISWGPAGLCTMGVPSARVDLNSRAGCVGSATPI